MFVRLMRRYPKPAWGIDYALVNGARVAIEQEVGEPQIVERLRTLRADAGELLEEIKLLSLSTHPQQHQPSFVPTPNTSGLIPMHQRQPRIPPQQSSQQASAKANTIKQ